MKKFSLVCPILLFLFSITLPAQEQKSLKISAFPKAPVIDGVVEETWNEAAYIEGFLQFEPEFGKESPVRTAVYCGFDDQYIYFAFKCFDPDPARISKAVTTRDGGLDDDDSVAVLIDTFNDKSNCYVFSTNLLGTQADGRISNNGRSEDYRWDTQWLSAARVTEYGWSAEIAIPFKSIKYNSGDDIVWGIDFLRYYPRRLEVSNWAGSREKLVRPDGFALLEGIISQGQNIKKLEVIPHALVSGGENQDLKSEIGLDSRYRINDNLSIDLTLNPDFALVEADVEQINLSRFEQYISEKRPFFLEGAEMFDQRMRQFYSRRIGDISWGTKLSGKLEDFDISMIAARGELGDGGENDNPTYTVARAKRNIFGSSNIGALYANRNISGENMGSLGLDATLFFSETFGMTAQLIRSHGPENDGKLAWFLRPSYDSANSHFHIRYTNIAAQMKNNMNAVGYFQDDNRKEVDTNISKTFWLNSCGLEKIDTEVNYNRYWNQDDELRSWSVEMDVELVLKNQFEIDISHEDELVIYEKEFRNDETQFEVKYDSRAGKEYFASYAVGTNEDADYTLTGAGTSLKITDAWNVSYSLKWLQFDPDPEDESTWIHVVRSNYYLNKDLYFKLFYQSNTVIDKNNIQVLMVWRFLPPFGSFQLAFQRGTSRFGESSDQGNTFFSKIAWVF